MKAKALLLFVLLSLAAIPSAFSEADITQFIKLVRLLRLDRRNSQEREEERMYELNQVIMSSVRDYGSAQRLESLVALFVSNVLGFDVDVNHIYDARKTPLAGKSDDKIYFVRQGALSCVVKAFASPELPTGKFLPELSGMVLLQELQLPHVEAVRPIALGKGSCNQRCYGMILETTAPGVRCDMVVQACKSNDPHRPERLQKVFRMFAAIGIGFKELHERHDGFCYQHGDAHLQNIFYDESRHKIVLIDLARLHRSVDILRKPIASGRSDVLRLRWSLSTCGEGILSAKEISQLLRTFSKSYKLD